MSSLRLCSNSSQRTTRPTHQLRKGTVMNPSSPTLCSDSGQITTPRDYCHCEGSPSICQHHVYGLVKDKGQLLTRVGNPEWKETDYTSSSIFDLREDKSG